jgi:hypothetical protein
VITAGGWLLATLEIDADLGPVLVAPRGLDEDMSTVAVTGLGDRAAAFAIPAGVFPRDEPEVTGQLPRMFEAAPIHDLGGEHHRGMERDAAEALEALDHGRERRGEREPFDRAIEFVPPLQLVGQQGVVLPEDQPIVRGQG